MNLDQSNMHELTFITSNIAKLAHARYLCRHYDINIIQHKLLHYGKGYEEPRLFERNKLLEESVKDAIIRWKKNISDIGNRFYFLEDTSVKIHALSTEDEEIPGVDIKYWMLENTFEQLDNELKQHNNDRSVTVYSHLILVLTKDLQEKYKHEYIIFKSQAVGFITDKEYSFETNLLYPWLDNKSFNKWFIPDGEKDPVSTLSIERSEKGDFRKSAFEDMLLFLLNNNKIHEKRKKEISYRFIFEPLFLITGPTCAGKTTIGKYLLEHYNYYHIEASDFMTFEYHETLGNKSKVDIGEFAKEILKIKPFVVVDRILSFLKQISDVSRLVITGFRTSSEIKYFIENSSIIGEIKSVFVNAESDVRFQRWLNRNRNLNDNQREKFDLINNMQNEMGLFAVSEMSDIEKIENNSTIENYFENFEDSFLKDKIEHSIMKVIDISILVPKSLEDIILLSLANDYESNEQSYFTTTEISHKINKTFKTLIKEKHKDNVSRYFNQRFYPYYEIKTIGSKIKYKLSPTGYSKAYSIIQNLST